MLNLWKTYELIECYKTLEGEYLTCSHCGRIITNIAIIESEGKKYNVWSGCVKKLLELDGSDYWKNKQIEKEVNDYFKICNLFSKAYKVKYWEWENPLGAIHYEQKDQKKTKVFSVNKFLKYKSDIWQSVWKKYSLNCLIRW